MLTAEAIFTARMGVHLIQPPPPPFVTCFEQQGGTRDLFYPGASQIYLVRRKKAVFYSINVNINICAMAIVLAGGWGVGVCIFNVH